MTIVEKSITLAGLLSSGAENSPALNAPDRAALTYGALRKLIGETTAWLNDHGIGRNDPVAIVLPNGPEMASAFVAVASAATSAPLNPAYQADEFAFYLDDLSAKALLIQQGMQSPARDVALEKNLPIIELVPSTDSGAGDFTLVTDSGILNAGAASNLDLKSGPAEAEDVALVLHTSGTTSRPKIVPLSQRNICASGFNIATTLALGAEDRCLNVMPLFHIHGLIAAVLSSLTAGAEICCTPGFNALKFFGWLDDVKPSWYTAVPTMHQAILSRVSRNTDIVENANLRFVRSSSAALPPQVLAKIEETFGCPLVEAYGMTEAAHQMACNPLPPLARKPGSVGLAAGPEVCIMNLSGDLLERGQVGEIVIRGDNVTSGYQNNPKANEEGYTNGWFRTGDQGVIDEDGYISLTGRLKEIINRGGEKISPREVDEVLLDHPDVAQAVTFAVKHEKLGEDVAAAITLREGAELGEREVRNFAAERLAAFKVPRKVLVLDEIPKGATGKIQRIGLAKKLGLEE